MAKLSTRLAAVFTACAVITGAANAQGPVTPWHFAPNNNEASGTFPPGAVGFNLADVNPGFSTSNLKPNTKALIWLGMCNGVDTTFRNAVDQYKNNSLVFAFYLKDEPRVELCPPANLKAMSDYIHNNLPGGKTFIVLNNISSSLTPDFTNTYNPGNTNIDYFGVAYYPCRSEISGGGCRFEGIPQFVDAAVASGVPVSTIIPVYQAFGCTSTSGCTNDRGGYYRVPTVAQEEEILRVWGLEVPNPAFDFAYTWGPSTIQLPLRDLPGLKDVFLAHNTPFTPGDPLSALVTYQWNRDGSPISGATSSTYTPASADSGHKITVSVSVVGPPVTIP